MATTFLHSIDPCDRCSRRTTCSVPSLLAEIRHPWGVPDVDFAHPFMETMRAESKKEGGLKIALRCSRFEELKNAQDPDRR